MKNTFKLIGGISLTLLMASPVWAGQGTRTGQLPAPDDKFVQDAVAGGKTEVQLGQMAQQKAASPAVREFGAQMARDHAGLNVQLQRVLTEQGITEPGGKEKSTRSTGAMEGHSGQDFDHAYMQNMISDHKKDLAEFKKEAAEGKDPEIRAWAAQTVPTLEQHLQKAEQTDANLPK
ncbi:MAG TPA: DUF4142 domain-containing protein [Verrucomicrobiae bacterium]|jgi:putative membrane protein|nr:DUF4142 domain-containing protein [Verrucomicrobiae bacterium]